MGKKMLVRGGVGGRYPEVWNDAKLFPVLPPPSFAPACPLVSAEPSSLGWFINKYFYTKVTDVGYNVLSKKEKKIICSSTIPLISAPACLLVSAEPNSLG